MQILCNFVSSQKYMSSITVVFLKLQNDNDKQQLWKTSTCFIYVWKKMSELDFCVAQFRYSCPILLALPRPQMCKLYLFKLIAYRVDE